MRFLSYANHLYLVGVPLCLYTTPLRDLAPMGEVAMLAGRRDDGLVVLALFEKPENLVLILWFLSSDAN